MHEKEATAGTKSWEDWMQHIESKWEDDVKPKVKAPNVEANSITVGNGKPCGWCGFKNHLEKDCRKKKRGEPKKTSGGQSRRSWRSAGNGAGKDVKCWKCGGPHFKRDCPKKDQGGGGGGNAVDSLFVGTVELDNNNEEPLLINGEGLRFTLNGVDNTRFKECFEFMQEQGLDFEPFDITEAFEQLEASNHYRARSTSHDEEDLPFFADREEDDDSDDNSVPELSNGDDDSSSDEDSMPKLMKRGKYPELSDSKDDDDSSIASCVTIDSFEAYPQAHPIEPLTGWGDMDSDSDSEDEWMPELIERKDMDPDSDSDSESEYDDDDDDDDDSVPPLQKFVAYAGDGQDVREDGMWLIDTGAKGHLTSSEEALRNQRKPDVPHAKVATGTLAAIKTMGELQLKPIAEDFIFEAKKMNHLPEIQKDILSLGCLIDDDWTPEFQDDKLVLRKRVGSQAVKMECHRESDGMWYLKAERISAREVNNVETPEPGGRQDETDWKEVAVKGVTADGKVKDFPKIVRIDINEAHDRYGHIGESLLRKTCKHHDIKLQHTMESCDACNRTKAKQRNLSKTSDKKADKAGQRLYLDAAGPYPPSTGGNQYHWQAVDEYTSTGFIGFSRTKKGIDKWLEKQVIEPLEAKGIKIEFIRADNAGENVKALEAMCKRKGITLELTAPDTPQMNGVVERRIAVLQRRGHASMIAADFNEQGVTKLWAEAVKYANDLHNISLNTTKDVPPAEMLTGKKSKKLHMAMQFGRVGYVTIRQKIKAKWMERSFKAIHVGFADNHSDDTYKFYNPKTNRMFTSRDVVWDGWKRTDPKADMKKIFEQYPDLEHEPAGLDDKERELVDDPDTDDVHVIPEDDAAVSNSTAGRKSLTGGTAKSKQAAAAPKPILKVSNPVVQVEDTNSDDEEQEETDQSPRSQRMDRGDEEEEPKPSARVARQLRMLDTSYNPTMDSIDVIEDSADGEKLVHFVFNTELASDYGEPTGFKEAVNGPDKIEWLQASKDEVKNFLKRGSWSKVSRKVAQREGRKIVHTKWVYKKKDEQDGSVRYKGTSRLQGFHADARSRLH